MKKLLTITAIVFFISCGGYKQVKHAEFPDAINAKMTASHVRLLGTNFFVVPPQGFVKTEHSNQYEIPGTNMQNFSIDRSVAGVKYPATVEELKQEKEKGRDKVLVVKKITYNGMPGLYYERLSMDKFYTAEIIVPLKDGTTLLIRGNYSYESSEETVTKILNAMQQALYDETYVVDYEGDKGLSFRLDDSGSSFKFASTDYGVTTFTVNGKPCSGICSAPYLLLFDAGKKGRDGTIDKIRLDKEDFPSYERHLKTEGYGIKQQLESKEFKHNGNPAREKLFSVTDLDGQPALLLLTEVGRDFSVVVTIGVAKDGNMQTVEEMRRLVGTLKITD